jgi:hypothetical protein
MSQDDGLELNYVAMSGQGNDASRIGFRYNHQVNIFSAFSEYDQACPDAPGQDFLKNILAQEMPANINLVQSKPPLFSKSPSMFLASVATEPVMIVQAVEESQVQAEDDDFGIPMPKWDLTGWKFVIPLDQENKNLVVILDRNGNEVELHEWDYKVPGLLKYEDPYYYIVTDEAAFNASGHRFAVKKVDLEPLEVAVAYYEKEMEISHAYSIENLNSGFNSLNIENVQNDEKILLNEQALIGYETKTRDTSQLDLRVQAEVSSEELNIPEEPAIEFSDIKSPLLREAVAYLVEREVVSGYPDGTFQPDRVINRAEALKIIFESIGLDPSSETLTANPFPDVDNGQWFAAYVDEAKKRGIISGYADGSYRPVNEVNKAEFLKIALSAQESYEAPSTFSSALSQFSDLDKSQWYMPFVTYAVEHGYLDKTTKLKPTEGMTRGEAAMIIYRIMKGQE